MRADRAQLIAHYSFPLDRFQLEAMDALDEGQSVLVAAPTGSGKTVVAEYGIEAARRAGRRAFYTAPIKALSNQKFHDLIGRYGSEQVGLLTGDNAINGDAPIVVMTTEVLRNMIYGRSRALADLALVVLDEVHFLQDTYRGPVWEEVIIHLPEHVRLVCLSATVSNAKELTDWITTVRGPTTAVVEEKRPVRLENLFMVGDKTADRLHMLPTLINDRPNSVAMRLTEEGVQQWRGGRGRRSGHAKRKLFTPNRIEVVERLDDERMLPAIYFIFSRNQCDEAAKQCLASGLHLTTGEQRERIREIVDARLGAIETADLAVLGFGQFLAQLEAGFAAHHAGMVPPFKEVVEACFAEGLVKVVFATETLAVGINMPARTVVIDKLTKFTGEHHAMLTPGEYTQLTGRAGRRGIDDLGHAIVLWNPFTPFDQVANLAASRWFHLNSAFRPTYNMAANLVRTYTSEEAHHLLNLSFAQYQADGDLVRMESRIGRRQAQLTELTEQASSPYGDIDDYRRRLREADHREPHMLGRGNDPIDLAIMKLRPGDVIYVDKGKYSGRAVVLTTANRKGGMRLTTLTSRRNRLMLSAADFDDSPSVLGRIELPTDYSPNRNDYQREVVHRLEKARLLPLPSRKRARPVEVDADGYHPVEDDPDLKQRLKAAGHAERIAREIEDMRSRVRSRSQSIARDFDRVLGILDAWGYVRGWKLTDAGAMLARTFHESDLLVVECVRQGMLDDLDAPTLAGLTSVFVYEHRSPDAPPAAWFPNNSVRKRWLQIAALSAELRDIETEDGLIVHRAPDATFLAIAYAWAAGEGFAEVVEAEELTGGDFVRTMKQLIDLLRQLAIIAPVAETRRTAEQAADALFRGVVAASSAVDIDDDEPEHMLAPDHEPRT